MRPHYLRHFSAQGEVYPLEAQMEHKTREKSNGYITVLGEINKRGERDETCHFLPRGEEIVTNTSKLSLHSSADLKENTVGEGSRFWLTSGLVLWLFPTLILVAN